MPSTQAYPLPPAYGAIAGYVFGALSALGTSIVLFFAQMDLDAENIGPRDDDADKTKGTGSDRGKTKKSRVRKVKDA